MPLGPALFKAVPGGGASGDAAGAALPSVPRASADGEEEESAESGGDEDEEGGAAVRHEPRCVQTGCEKSVCTLIRFQCIMMRRTRGVI